MASSLKLLCILLFLLAFFSIQIHGRQLFNKVSSSNTEEEGVTITRDEPNNLKAELDDEQRQEEPEPSFYAQTTESSGYGLYARDQETESTSYKPPYVTPVKYHPNEPYNAIPTNNEKHKFEEETRFAERNNNNDDDDDAYGNRKQKSNFGEGRFAERNNNNGDEYQRQGMSDTRFLEKGRYFYDINSERNTVTVTDKYRPQSFATPSYANLQGKNSYQNEELQQFDHYP